MAGSPIHVVFIAGHGRCGSTLLEMMLSNLNGYVSAGELAYIWERGFHRNEICSCGTAFRQCPFWRGVAGRAFGSMESVDVQAMMALSRKVDRFRYTPMAVTGFPWGSYKDRLRDYVAVMGRLYEAIRAESGKQVIVDSSKHPTTLFMLRHLETVRLHIVHMVRDCRGAAYSWQRKKVRIVGENILMDTYSPSRTAWEWVFRNSLIRFSKHVESSYVLVRYEDLVSSPVEILKRVLSVVGSPPQEFRFLTGKSMRLSAVSHTVSGNPIRFQRDHIDLCPDMEWRAEMKALDKWVVTSLTFPWLWKYGYPIL